MKVKFKFFKLPVAVGIILFCIYTNSVYAFSVTKPLITPPLLANGGSSSISIEQLLQFSLDFNHEPDIQWIDNARFIYKLSSITSQPDQAPPLIQMYNIENHQSVSLTEGDNPIVSPNKQWVAFTTTDKNKKQLWIININTQETKQISQLVDGLSGVYAYHYNYVWSPDSKKLVLTHQNAPSADDYWDNIHPATSQIETIEIATGSTKTIASIDAMIQYLSWLPHSEEIIFTKLRIGRLYNDPSDSASLELLNTETTSQRTLAQFEGLQQSLHPVPSSDGEQIAIMYDADHPIYTFLLSVGVISAKADIAKNPITIQRITQNMQLSNPQWSYDNKSIFALRAYGPYAQLNRIDLSTGETTQLTHDHVNIITYRLSPDGRRFAFIGENIHGQIFLKLASSDGTHLEDLIIHNALPNNVALSEVREIEWDTLDYPTPMRGLLILPLNYQRNKNYPLIVDIHGGDVGDTLNSLMVGGVLAETSLEWQWWAAKGYAVFVPEFRSSGAFGSLAFDRDLFQEHDRLGGDLKDIDSGVTYLIEQGIADSNHLGVIGESAGGLRANWFAVATHRYQAIFSHEGWADQLEMSLKLPPVKRIEEMQGGSPQDVPENYIKNSPVYFASDATTPILFMMGNPKHGGADPFQTVFKLFNLIKNKGIETEFVEYPDEGHSFEKRENKRDALNRVTQWIENHLKKQDKDDESKV